MDGEGDGGDRGPAFLPARRDRPDRHRPRRRRRRARGEDRRGRLDDHAGARAEPLPHARADAEAEADRGVPRDQARQPLVEGQDPHRVHERGLLRKPRVRDRGGRGDVLLDSGGPAEPRAVGNARRPAAGAVDLRPVPPAAGRDRATQRGAARDARQRRDYVHPVREGGARPQPASPCRPPLHAYPRAVLLQLRRGSPSSRSTARTPSAQAGSRSTRRSIPRCSVRRAPRSRTSSRCRPILPRRSCRSIRAPAPFARWPP